MTSRTIARECFCCHESFVAHLGGSTHAKEASSQGALYAVMRSALNSARPVAWRKINDNLFMVQFRCLEDWEQRYARGAVSSYRISGVGIYTAESEGH